MCVNPSNRDEYQYAGSNHEIDGFNVRVPFNTDSLPCTSIGLMNQTSGSLLPTRSCRASFRPLHAQLMPVATNTMAAVLQSLVLSLTALSSSTTEVFLKLNVRKSLPKVNHV